MAETSSPQSRLDRARAAQRLASDGKPVPIGQLTRIAEASKTSIARWIESGKSGIYLDAILDPLLGWCSNAAAIRRFKAEVATKRASKGGAA